MNAYLAGQGINVTIGATDSAGNPVVASTASYRVIDQDGDEIVALTPIPAWNNTLTSFTATLPAAVNTLAAGNVRELRTVELHMQADGAVAGTVVNSVSYVIEAAETLVIPTTSFLTYQQAILVGFSLIGLDRWQTASKQKRTAALELARRNLCQLRYRHAHERGQSYLTEDFAVGDLESYTLAEFNALPAEFREALARAQVVEADHLMRPDSDPLKMREQGIRSHTVGESSTSFTGAGAAQSSICAAAMKELSRFIDHSIRIGRS